MTLFMITHSGFDFGCRRISKLNEEKTKTKSSYGFRTLNPLSKNIRFVKYEMPLPMPPLHHLLIQLLIQPLKYIINTQIRHIYPAHP